MEGEIFESGLDLTATVSDSLDADSTSNEYEFVEGDANSPYIVLSCMD
jgi:hypothetical protein